MNHEWNVTPKEAIEIQKKVREEVRIVPFDKEIKFIAGADVSLNMFGKDVYAGIVVLSYPELEVVEESFVKEPVPFAYIPGLLSFREIPSLLKCYAKLKQKPDLIVVDGQGIAHPRRLGIASHLGVMLDVPTIGCGKSPLYGRFEKPLNEKDSYTDIIDPKTGERLGVAYRSKVNSNPLILSPGHMTSVEDAKNIVVSCLRGYRLPEPTRQAHLAVNRFRLEEK